MIEAEDLSSAMDYLFQEKKDWGECFKILKENAKLHNFESLFTYHLIRKQVDVKDFESVFKEILNNSHPWQLKQLYHSFFNTDIQLDIEKYLEQNRYDNKFSDVQNMRYIFLTKENNQIALEPTSIEYLKVLLSNNMTALVDAGIAPFFYDLTPNITSLKPILENLKNTIDGNKLLIPLFHTISSMSYELPESTNKTTFDILVKTIPDIKNQFEQNLLYKTSYPDKSIQVDPSLMYFLNVCEVNVTEMLNHRYQQEYEKILQVPIDLQGKPAQMHSYYIEEPLVKLAVSISSSIAMGYKENTSIDLSQIDIKQSALKNFVYLKTLEVKLGNDEPVKAPLDLCNYINQVYKKEKEAFIPSLGTFLNLELMASKLLYSRLDLILEDKPAISKKLKI
jgi:hypothetical protein